MYSMYEWKIQKNKTEKQTEDMKRKQQKLFCVYYLLKY